jgi:two-component system NarL family sensor kinase
VRVLRSPVALFLVIGLVTAAAILLGSDMLADRAASDEAVAEAENTTQLLAASVIGPEMPRGLVYLRRDNMDKHVGAIDDFDRTIQKRLLKVERPFLINMWAADGRLIYTSQMTVLVQNLDDLDLSLDADQRRVLADGGVGSEIADPDRPQDEHSLADAGTDGMLRIYTRMTSPEGKPVLFEAYFTLDEIGQRRSQIFDSFRWITIAGLGLLIMVATVILVGLTRRLRHAAKERERLLRSAMDASDAERRRIARDLHDGVVQDLAGTAFSVSAVARTPELANESRDTLDAAGGSCAPTASRRRSPT